MTDDEEIGAEPLSIGDELRRAREARGLSLDEIAGQTRIPIRHLQNIEREEWDALPAPTYAVGFGRNYANAVGLDGAAIAASIREQIGGVVRPRAPTPEYYEPADPSRVPPRSIVLFAGLFAAILIAIYFIFFSTLGGDGAPQPAPPSAQAPVPGPAQPAPQALAPQAATGRPVTLTATGEVWLRVSDGASQLFSGNLMPGQSFAVPATAAQPVLRTGRPQMLRASVGGRDLGPLEPEERTVDGVSLLPQDLAARAQVPRPAAPPPLGLPPAQ